MVSKTTMLRKIFALTGFVISSFGFFWLGSLPIGSYGILWRFGFIAAALSTLGVVTFCWATLAAFVARERNWSPQTCMKAGWPFIPLAVIASVAGSQFWRAADLLTVNAVFVGFLCRRLVYPHVTDEQAAAPEPPLSLFQK
jgi:hypothetical protein